MTDTTHNELNEAGLSRRRALQAGVGAGVGLVAWSGATITSMHGTPAYAAVCTQLTYSFEATDMATNQSSGCLMFSYQNAPPLAVKVGDYDWNVPNGDVGCADTPVCYQFTFPEDEKCRITIKVHQNKYRSDTVIFGGEKTYNSDDGTMEFCFPSTSGNPGWNPAFLAQFSSSNTSNTFWSVFINCVSESSGSGCELPNP